MKRPIYTPGGYYHLYNRGRSRLSIFHDPKDYHQVLELMKSYSQKYSLVIIAYCLLANHYHFLVRQNNTPRASLLPQRIFNSYSKTYNLKYQHSGTLFEGPARAIPVTEETYLLHLCRYIHANPVLHGFVPHIKDWPYSNYHEWIGTRNGKLIDHAFVQEHFPQPGAYQEFVREYLLSRRHPEGMEYLNEW
ncbi:MAG: transposase [Anaerolineae bacterium]|nr:transposase [Anaerolineae bacterium]